MKRLVLFLLLASPFVFAGCGDAPIENETETKNTQNNEDSSSTENEPESEKTKGDEDSAKTRNENETNQGADGESSTEEETVIDYSVGNKIMVESSEYYVVSNTVDSGEESGEQENSEELAEIMESLSVSEAKKLAAKYFGEKNILLLRTKGKVYVPYGQKSEYENAYNALTADLTEDQDEINYFEERIDQTDETAMYTDYFLILGENKERLGGCNKKWQSSSIETFEGGKTLFDLLKDFSSEVLKTIRNTKISEYQIKKYDESKNVNYDLESYKFAENGKYRISKPAPDSMYMAGEKIYAASKITNEWDSDGNWTRAYIYLSAVYKNDTGTAGIMFSVYNTDNYLIHGSSHTGRQMYGIRKIGLQFDENNTYTSDNVVIPEDADIYSDIADMRYDENALSVPVELIKNEDGSISFGQKVLEWAKNWRDHIVETHEDAEIYE